MLDELSLDDSNYYKQKISKWVMNSLRSVSDGCFWYFLWTAHYTRAPLLHFYRILCIKLDSVKERMPIVELVSSRIQTIQQEFNDVANNFYTWTTDAINFAKMETSVLSVGSGSVPGEDTLSEASLLGAASILLLHNVAAFDRRIATLFRKQLGFVLE